MMRKLILPFIILLGLLLRVIALDKYPIGFTQDEAGLGYDAYSLLLTGKDQWGSVLPLTLRSFGDFKLPAYSYLAIPSVAFFGLNEFSVRLPSAVFGTLAVVFTYLMVLEVCKRKDLALWSAFLLSISPWHISLSRGAFEANLTSFFLPLCVWLFYRGLKKHRNLWLASVFFGINIFTYHSARIFTPILMTVLILINYEKLNDIFKVKTSRKHLLLSVIIFSIFFITAFYTMFTGAGKRATDVVIFNPTDRWESMAAERFEAIVQGVPQEVARVFSNKPKYIFSQFINNYLSYLSPEFLFVKGAGDWSYGMIAGRGVMYLFEVLFLSFGIITFLRKKDSESIRLIIFWILLSPIPAAVSKAPGFSGNRAAVMMPAIQIMSAYGIVSAINYLKLFFKQNYLVAIFNYLIAGTLLLSLVFFLEDYIYHTPIRSARQMQYGKREAVQYVSQIQQQYRGIFISRSLGVPQVWVEFYEKIDPKTVQNASKDWLRYESDYGYLDQLDGYRLEKFTFGSINTKMIKKAGDILVVASFDEVPLRSDPLKTIYYPDGKPAIVIFDSSQL